MPTPGPCESDRRDCARARRKSRASARRRSSRARDACLSLRNRRRSSRRAARRSTGAPPETRAASSRSDGRSGAVAANCFLVVRPNRRVLFGDEQPQPDGGCHLAVGEVMHDFAGAPFARRRPRVELGVGSRPRARRRPRDSRPCIWRSALRAFVIHVSSGPVEPDYDVKVRLQADRQYSRNGFRVVAEPFVILHPAVRNRLAPARRLRSVAATRSSRRGCRTAVSSCSYSYGGCRHSNFARILRANLHEHRDRGFDRAEDARDRARESDSRRTPASRASGTSARRRPAGSARQAGRSVASFSASASASTHGAPISSNGRVVPRPSDTFVPSNSTVPG